MVFGTANCKTCQATNDALPGTMFSFFSPLSLWKWYAPERKFRVKNGVYPRHINVTQYIRSAPPPPPIQLSYIIYAYIMGSVRFCMFFWGGGVVGRWNSWQIFLFFLHIFQNARENRKSQYVAFTRRFYVKVWSRHLELTEDSMFCSLSQGKRRLQGGRERRFCTTSTRTQPSRASCRRGSQSTSPPPSAATTGSYSHQKLVTATLQTIIDSLADTLTIHSFTAVITPPTPPHPDSHIINGYPMLVSHYPNPPISRNDHSIPHISDIGYHWQ